MKKFSFVVVLFLFSHFLGYSQGFDWELSPRLPFSIPTTYIGVAGSASKNNYSGSITLFENFYNCGKFSQGSGYSNSFGFKGEHWYKPNIALSAAFIFQNSKANFITEGDSFPVQIKNIPKIVKVENELIMDYSFIAIDFGAKHKIASTNFYLGFNLEIGIKLSTKYELYELVKSPPEYHFIDNSQRRKIVEGRLTDLSLLFFIPKATFGYDATVFPGIYASPSISIQLPLFNLTKQENLKLLSFQIGISILRGIR